MPSNTQHVACDMHLMCCTWFAHNCALATSVYLLETVLGTVRRLQKSWSAQFNAIIIITVKYLVSTHYHVSAHPLLLDKNCVKGDVPSKRPPPYFREEENETINLNSSASGNRKLSVTMIFSGNVTCFTLRKIGCVCLKITSFLLPFVLKLE